MKTITVEEMLQMFENDHRRYAEPALYRSFSKYADRRDELIGQYSKHFGVPTKVFEDRLLEEQIRNLT
jgi:hypothetical protein